MKKIIRKIEEQGIVQVTIADERWYIKEVFSEFIAVPSVTWIAGYYPKGVSFYKWLANKGWEEAEAIKVAAGDKGNKVHYAIADLIAGKEVRIDSQYINLSTEKLEQLTLEEYDCLLSFKTFCDDYNPEFLLNEYTIFSNEYSYAGTIDLICKIKDRYFIVDFKTGQNIFKEHELQISAYKHAITNSEILELAILQLGYNRNKKKYKFTEIDDKFDLFLTARKIWAEETNGVEVFKKDYPLILKLKDKKQGGDNDVNPAEKNS